MFEDWRVLFEDLLVHVQSLYLDENELSLCRNNIDELSEPSESENWLILSSEEQLDSELVIETIQHNSQDELDYWDSTMVAEYSEELFKYMEELEVSFFEAVSPDAIVELTLGLLIRNLPYPTRGTWMHNTRSSGICAPL